MPSVVTLNVVNNNNQKIKEFSCLTENKSFINSVINVGKDNTIKESDIDLLNKIAKRSGDAGVIEQSDLNGNEKKKLASNKGFDKYYDIKVSEDGKYLQVTVKDAGVFCVNPNLATIKSDFGLKNGVLVKEGFIPHKNEDVIPSRANGNFDGVTLKVGQTINLPVSEINISGSPRGGFGRFMSWLNY